jgi:hypothetical protein
MVRLPTGTSDSTESNHQKILWCIRTGGNAKPHPWIPIQCGHWQSKTNLLQATSMQTTQEPSDHCASGATSEERGN